MWPWRRRSDEDFAEEIRANIALEIDRLIAEGVSPNEARTAALRTFGNMTRARERFYESGRVMWLDDLQRDVKYALRALANSPGFAAITVVTLALGIGANAAIFSLLNPLIFRPLPVPDPERVSRVFSGRSGGNVYGRMSYPNYTDLRAGIQAFESLAASSWPVPFSVRLGTGQSNASQTEVVWGAVVSGNYFSTLDVRRMALGRAFLPDDDSVPDASPSQSLVTVCGKRYWRETRGSLVKQCA
jgi:hypothetical protein